MGFISRVTAASTATKKYDSLIEDARIALEKIKSHLDSYGSEIELNDLEATKGCVDSLIEQLNEI